jgi:asparagine synthetase B (glutamine-hydrolysing)
MCGFIVSPKVSRLLPLIAHRGIRSKIMGWVGHVRLPIVGVGEEHDQPVARNHWVVTFVGEVLDFKEYRPDDTCDLPLVVDAWIANGPRALFQHDGFWAVAAHNLRDNSIHLLCDYLAQKPIYYRTDQQCAGSELDCVEAAGPVTPDEVYFASVIKWGYCPDPQRTPYQEVKRVLPGEHVRISTDLRITREVVDPLMPRTLTPMELKKEIIDAVRRRVLSSDVPVACLLSGGLDSSIAYSIAKRYGDVVAYFAEDPKAPDNMMRFWAAAVADEPKGVRKTKIIPWSHPGLARALRVMQEPIDLGSLIPQICLADAVQERVCLTGDGADEMFGGYGRSDRYDSQASDVWQELVCWHLPRLDRVMMRNCVEVRTPFLARRVAAAALATPREERTGKKILRDIFRDNLPRGLADAPKVPLRTREVEVSREQQTIIMVDHFRRIKWPEGRSSAARSTVPAASSA